MPLTLLVLALVSSPAARADLRTLQTANSSGRTGAVYLPSGYEGQALPLLVLFHGTGGSGRQIAALFQEQADASHFIILAPDSRVSPDGQLTWQVGINPGEVTEDVKHTMACRNELLGIAGITIDSSHVLAAGYSGGGSFAPYISSVTQDFTAFAVLHGGVFPSGLGPHRTRGWFSTGSSDDVRPVSQVQSDMHSIAGIFAPLEWRAFSGGHELSAQERDALIKWWLDGTSTPAAIKSPAPSLTFAPGQTATPTKPAPRIPLRRTPQMPTAVTPGSAASVDFESE